MAKGNINCICFITESYKEHHPVEDGYHLSGTVPVGLALFVLSVVVFRVVT